MASEFQSLLQQKKGGSGRSMKDTMLKYLSYYPLFLFFIALCLGAAYLYLRYAVPLYSASTFINVKGETTTSKSGSSSGSADLISTAMNGGRSVINLDNELARLRSARLMEKVVRNSDLNISYYSQGHVLKTDVYHHAPFRLIPRDLQDSSQKISLTVSKLNAGGFTLQYGDEKAPTIKNISWNKPFRVSSNTYLLTPRSDGWNEKDVYIVEWNPVMATVYEILPKVSVGVVGKTSNISLGISIENPFRGEDILNKMVYEFIQMNLDDQNRAAQDKIYFIEERLGKVSGELGDVEKNLASYQSSNLMVGGQEASGNYGISLGAANTAVAEISTQLKMLGMLRNLVTDPSTSKRVLPATLSINDPTIGSLISKYNELLLTREREAPLVASNSLVLKDLDNQIAVVRGSILSSVQNTSKTLQLQLANYKSQGAQYKANVSKAPQKERVAGGISREKSVKENLYLYLLQRREEAAISKTSTSPYEQIDFASSWGPVSPNKKSVYQFAVLIGLALPVGLVFLRDLLSGKVERKDEVEEIACVPVIGEVSHIRKLKGTALPSLEGGIVGEQFRIMRANFKLQHKGEGCPVILITSAISGEGKSFISQNLAAVMAKGDKKVALLEFDLRKPASSPLSAFHGKGLTDYLQGQVDLDEIIRPLEGHDNLHIYPSGSVCAEAGDLLEGDNVGALLEKLKKEYDCIVINAAPVGLVSDALSLQQYSTAIGYIVRQGFTPKKQLQFLHSLVESGKFKDTHVIFNGVKSGARYGQQVYGYGNKNPYFNRKGKTKKIKRKANNEQAALQ